MAIPNANLSKVAFSTAFRYQQISKRGHVDYTVPSNSFVDIYIPHGLAYKPYFRLYIRFPNSSRYYQMESGPATFGLVGSYQIEGIGSDATNIIVRIADYAGAPGTGTIYYRIYEEQQ